MSDEDGAREDGARPDGRAPTIYDVAREAGVAPSTVSRAFSRPGRVRTETAAHIRRVAESLGYRTNPLARALSTAHSRMLALVVSDIANPFYAEVIRGSQTAATQARSTVVLIDTQESAQLERSALERTLPIVDGIVLGGSRLPDSAIRTLSKQRPVVVLNRSVADVPCVVTDNARGSRRAAEHLGELGHDHITYVAGPEASWADGMRWRSLREAGFELHLRVRRIGPFRPDVPGGVRAAEEFLEAPTSAVLAYNDQLAIGLIRGLAAKGVRVPGDVSVVGFDNIFAADLITPGLTTVAAPLRTEGITATRHLLGMIEGREQGGPRSAGQHVLLPVQLVVRGSTARRSRKRISPASGATRVPPSARQASTSTVEGTSSTVEGTR